MQLVDRHAGKQFSLGVGEASVDVQVADRLAVRQFRQVGVDAIDGRHDRAVVAREDAHEDDRGSGSLLTAEVDQGGEAARDVGDLGVITGLLADVVGSAEQHDDLGVHAIQFAVLQPPEHVLGVVCAPAEVAGIPAAEVLVPMGQEIRVVGRTPAPRDRVAEEVDRNAAVLRLFEQLQMGEV